MCIEIPTSKVLNETLEEAGDLPVFVNFMAKWCDDCHKLKDMLD